MYPPIYFIFPITVIFLFDYSLSMEEQSSVYEDYPRLSNASTLSYANLPEPLHYYPHELNDEIFDESSQKEVDDSEGAFHTFDASRLTQLKQAREEGPSQLGHTESFTFTHPKDAQHRRESKPKKGRQHRRQNVMGESTSERPIEESGHGRGGGHEHGGGHGRGSRHERPPSPVVDLNESSHGKCTCTIL